MNVDIGEIVSRVHVVEGESVLSPRVLAQVVRVVLEAVHEEEAHRRRIEEEIGTGHAGPEAWR